MAKKIGQRFKTVGWVSLMVLIFTGASQLLDESGSARIETSWGLIMMLKLFRLCHCGRAHLRPRSHSRPLRRNREEPT